MHGCNETNRELLTVRDCALHGQVLSPCYWSCSFECQLETKTESSGFEWTSIARAGSLGCICLFNSSDQMHGEWCVVTQRMCGARHGLRGCMMQRQVHTPCDPANITRGWLPHMGGVVHKSCSAREHCNLDARLEYLVVPQLVGSGFLPMGQYFGDLQASLALD
jgi:hypothetical protein